jgi:DNA mismatch endonuclease (patch repair protein)
MADKMTPEQRHRCMSRIRGRDTKPELVVRRWLWRQGFRYRLYVKSLPGRPDIVMRKWRTVIFVNGCFWHGHESKNTVRPHMHNSGKKKSPATVNATHATKRCCKPQAGT